MTCARLQHPVAARERGAVAARALPLQRRPHLGLGDRRARRSSSAIALVPLTVRQIHSMQALQKHAPEMKEIQRKYKGDRQKMNEEMMRFYKENHINPAASCLPLLAQAPVFISLYFVLKNFSKHVPPGSDLSWLHFVPNITAKANSHWSGYVLLAVYAASQIFSTYFMSHGDGQDAAADHDVLPLVFITVIAHFPVGPRHLLGDDEPVDGRPGADHAPARAAHAGRGRRRLHRSARRGRRRRPTARQRRRQRRPQRSRSPAPEPQPRSRPKPRPAPPAAAREAKPRPTAGDEHEPTVEATGRDGRRGEVAGAARARAARALARQGGRPLPGAVGGRARSARRGLHAGPGARQRA